MQGRKRLIGIVAAVAGVLMLGLVLLLTWTWESPALTRLMVSSLSGDGVQVEAASARLSALRGVTLSGVRIASRLEDGQLTAEAEEVLLKHRVLPLLSGQIAVDEIVLLRPRIEVLWDAAKPPPRQKVVGGAAPAPPPAPAAEEVGFSLDLRVSRFALEDGMLSMREQDIEGEMVRFEGLDLELEDISLPTGAVSMVAAVRARGTLQADKLIASVVAEDVEGTLEIADGHVKIAKLALPTEFGTVDIGPLDLDLARDPYLYELQGLGKPIEVAKLLGASSGFGDGLLEFQVAGDGSPKGGPRGKGSLAIEGGKLGNLPLLATLESLLGSTQLVGRPYEAFTIPFVLDTDRLTLQPFAIEAGTLRLAAAGVVDMEGPLQLRIEVSLPRADVTVKEIPREVLEALTDVDGRVKLPIVIGGSLDQPKVRFDHRAWAGLAGRRAVDEVLKRLFN
jgi:hypothetical protein